MPAAMVTRAYFSLATVLAITLSFAQGILAVDLR